MNRHDLMLCLRALFAPRRMDRDLDDELAFHLEREAVKQKAIGATDAEARTMARARFGSVALSADECRDARGTAFIDGCVRDILYAFRTFRRAPLAAITIVATVAIGLGLVAVVFTILNVFLFRVDEVRRPDELFGVSRPTRPGAGSSVSFTRPEYEALRRETSVFTDAFAMLPDIDSRIDGRMMAGTLVTGNFFQVLGVGASRGRTLTPEDDNRDAARPVIVLSHRGWSRHFANDPDVVGRTVVVSGSPYVVVGVMPDGFRGLMVGAPDYWAPLSLLTQFRPIHTGREDEVGIQVVGRLKPGLTRQTALAGLVVWHAARTDGWAGDRRSIIELVPRRGTLPDLEEALQLGTPLVFAFGLILMLACANVANLLLARAVSRQREIGIRLSLGASRRRIVRQLLTESLLLALASAALGFLISRVVLRATVYAVTSTLAPELAEYVTFSVPDADWRVFLFLVVSAVVSTAFFGLAPALQATRLELVRTMRGEVGKDTRPRRSRNVLIGIQVTAAALLLTCSAVFLRSALASSTVDPGIRTADNILVDGIKEPTRAAILQAVRADPSVVSMAASHPDVLSRQRSALADAPDSTMTPTERRAVAYKLASPEYFNVLGIDIVRGRGFTPSERSPDAGVAVVSETVARQLWPGGDGIGRVLHLDPYAESGTQDADEKQMSSRTFTVVGITRDVPGFRFAQFIREADVFIPTSAEQPNMSLTVRVHGDPDQARLALLQRLTAIDPNTGQVMTLRTIASVETYLLQVAFWVTLVLGSLALALTLSGLFSVLSYLVEQRAKEIGVRIALGATMRDIGVLVLSQSARPVVLGLVAGAGLAAAMGIVLMATPAAASIGAIVHLFDPVAYAATLLCIFTACALAALVPALRAARINPIASLRQD